MCLFRGRVLFRPRRRPAAGGGAARRGGYAPGMGTVRDTAAVIDRVLAGAPDVAAELHASHDAAWTSCDPALLELTRLRIAMMLEHHAELAVRTPGSGVDEATVAELSLWPTSPRFTERDRACLTLVEQWLIDVADVSDEQCAAVAEHLGADGLASYASAILVLEQRQRLRLAWQQLFGPDLEVSA